MYTLKTNKKITYYNYIIDIAMEEKKNNNKIDRKKDQ